MGTVVTFVFVTPGSSLSFDKASFTAKLAAKLSIPANSILVSVAAVATSSSMRRRLAEGHHLAEATAVTVLIYPADDTAADDAVSQVNAFTEADFEDDLGVTLDRLVSLAAKTAGILPAPSPSPVSPPSDPPPFSPRVSPPPTSPLLDSGETAAASPDALFNVGGVAVTPLMAAGTGAGLSLLVFFPVCIAAVCCFRRRKSREGSRLQRDARDQRPSAATRRGSREIIEKSREIATRARVATCDLIGPAGQSGERTQLTKSQFFEMTPAAHIEEKGCPPPMPPGRDRKISYTRQLHSTQI